MIYYNLGKDITAFTTDRSIGRDKDLLLKALGMPDGHFLYPHQTHTDKVMQISAELFELPETTRKLLAEGKDAVICKDRGLVLGISTADCIPVLVYDQEHHAAAAIHAGWRGTVARIVEKGIAEMQIAFGTNPAMCTAAIGPGISFDSFEIGDEVYQTFLDAGFSLDETTAGLFPARSADGPMEKWHLDLKEINRQQLLSMGLKAENIYVSDVDTFTNTDYFSARREQKGTVKCGRILTGFVLN